MDSISDQEQLILDKMRQNIEKNNNFSSEVAKIQINNIINEDLENQELTIEEINDGECN